MQYQLYPLYASDHRARLLGCDAEGFTNALARAEPTSSISVLGRYYNQNCAEYGYCAVLLLSGGYMVGRSRPKRAKVRSTKAQFAAGLAGIISETTRLWRKRHLGYDQTKYVVEQARLGLSCMISPACGIGTLQQPRYRQRAWRRDSRKHLPLYFSRQKINFRPN
jgi:hypothetical protein